MNKVRSLELPLLLAAGVGLAFSFVVLTGFAKELTHAGLEGQFFRRFYSIFLTLLWVFLVGFGLQSVNRQHLPYFRWTVAGAISGYLSGILTFAGMELFRPSGLRLLAEQSRHIDDW